MSDIDENIFFRGATLQICSSLDIEISLRRCLAYLINWMPAKGMNLCLYRPDSGIMDIIAHITKHDDVKLAPLIPIPPEARASFECADDEKVRIINQPENDPATRLLTQLVGRPDSSFLSMRLELEGEWLGIVSIVAKGKNRYNEYHAHLLTLLHEPFAVAMSNALRYRQLLRLKENLVDDNQYLHQELLRLTGDEIIGKDAGLKNVMDQVSQVAATDSPVLLLGETGVGKEVIANALHYLSPRKEGPFIKVNCGAIPETLIDSELFGHEKGAFTGAARQLRGRFERAHSGTIFLDEIGELPLPAQVRLLRVIQHKEIERVGGTKAVPVDIRIIAATHRDLEKMVRADRFREDLWFRLNVFPIVIPPLRERKQDIAPLVKYFLQRKSQELKLRRTPVIDPQAVERLKSYHWPGNVRELENALEHALIRMRGRHTEHPLTHDAFAFLRRNRSAAPALDDEDEFLSLDDVTSGHIRRALTLSSGKIHGPGGAAERLRIKPTTLRYRMDKLGIPYRRSR